NSVGREIRTLEEDEPIEGKRLQLTIDYDVQKAIEDGFDQLGFNGAAVVLDPTSGDVLGFTSRPAYDPNAFAAGIDGETWAAMTRGLGVKSCTDLPNEVQGLVPSTEWKREKLHEKWYAGETISVGIGQGQVSVTQVSMAVYMSTLANGGTRVTPHLLKAVDD